MIIGDFNTLRNPSGPIVRYWFEHDSNNDNWVGRVTRNGTEVCVVVGASHQEVVKKAEQHYRKLEPVAA